MKKHSKQIAKLSLVAAVTASALLTSTAALAEVSANIGATTNYVWRGVSQSANAASVSGGIDYADDSGFYAGTWVGSLSDSDNGFEGTETDFYLGFSGEAEGFTYDVGYIYYAYTELEDSDFGEIYLNGGVGNFGFGVAYTINSEVVGDSLFDTGDMYYHVSYGGIDLGNEMELSLTAGMYDFDLGSDSDYAHFQADISKGDFTFSLSKAEAESGDDDFKFIASWGTSF